MVDFRHIEPIKFMSKIVASKIKGKKKNKRFLFRL
jgi:hypothetical protein